MMAVRHMNVPDTRLESMDDPQWSLLRVAATPTVEGYFNLWISITSTFSHRGVQSHQPRDEVSNLVIHCSWPWRTATGMSVTSRMERFRVKTFSTPMSHEWSRFSGKRPFSPSDGSALRQIMAIRTVLGMCSGPGPAPHSW